MSTVDKALSVLELFSENDPTLRLSEIARRMGWDKSNVQRYVTDLAARGMLEQDPDTKSYYLGATLTRLAMVRERTNPTAAETQKALKSLVNAIGETAHASRLIGNRLMISAIEETRIRGTRVYIDETEPLPLHASGSGIALLTSLPDEQVADLLGDDNKGFTSATPTSVDDILSLIAEGRRKGYVIMHGTFERDVVGISAPIRNYSGEGIGAVAVATPRARFSQEHEETFAPKIMQAANLISRCYGGA